MLHSVGRINLPSFTAWVTALCARCCSALVFTDHPQSRDAPADTSQPRTPPYRRQCAVPERPAEQHRLTVRGTWKRSAAPLIASVLVVPRPSPVLASPYEQSILLHTRYVNRFPKKKGPRSGIGAIPCWNGGKEICPPLASETRDGRWEEGEMGHLPDSNRHPARRVTRPSGGCSQRCPYR
jgi:hypothetical protein